MSEQDKTFAKFKEAALTEMKELVGAYNYEAAHLRADSILCELLKRLDCQDIVDAFEKVSRWYA